MTRPLYTAEISGAAWKHGPVAQFRTIRECRAWAESYGTTADRCTIRNAKGREVASHRRNGSAPFNWFKAEVGS